MKIMFCLEHETMNVCQRNVARFAHVVYRFDKIIDMFDKIIDTSALAACVPVQQVRPDYF